MTDSLALAASGSAWPLLLQAVTIPPLPTVDPALPDLWVALPTGEQATLPGLVWPEMAAAQPRRPGGRQPKPILEMVEIEIRTADRLLAEFQHPLPPASRRRFGRIAYALRAFGTPVAVCVSASAPNPSVAQDHGLHRLNTVELARIGRRDPAATLAALRLWREYLAPLFAERYATAAGLNIGCGPRSPTRCPAPPPALPPATASTAATGGCASGDANSPSPDPMLAGRNHRPPHHWPTASPACGSGGTSRQPSPSVARTPQRKRTAPSHRGVCADEARRTPLQRGRLPQCAAGRCLRPLSRGGGQVRRLRRAV